MSAEEKAWEDGVYADEIARALHDWPRDLGDYDAYDLTDPKHPTFYERFAERADVERKARKENPVALPDGEE
jgi:hypothetical protein